MNNRRKLLITIGAGVLAEPLSIFAQKLPAKIARIGFLSGAARPADSDQQPAPLRRALQRLGYADGPNLLVETRWAEGEFERLPGYAAELVRMPVDIIVTLGGTAAEAAKAATGTIPIVIVGAGDPISIGLVNSLAHPNGNITGVTEQTTELSGKRLQLLTETVPAASRVAVVWNSGDRAMSHRYSQISEAAQTLRVKLQPLGVRTAADFDRAIEAMKRERPDALFVVVDALTNIHRQRLLDFAAANRLPAMYEFSPAVADGALMSYGPNLATLFERAAYYVDRLLKGAKPSDLPIEQPTIFELVINMKTAKALGIKIPNSILVRADKVIE